MKAVVHRTGWLVPVILVLGALGLGASYGVAARSNPRIVTIPVSFAEVSSAIAPMSIAVFGPEIDLAKVQGAKACGECHIPEKNAWERSTHFTTFTTLHKLKDENNEVRARKIAKALDLKGSIKRNDLCYTCHYTSQIVNGRRKSIEGVSCESCHGPGKDWTSPELHHEKAKDAQTSEQREAILKACEEAGMLRPKNIYLVATNCYSCHTVPNEKLVNVGGHPAGSRDFELVSWSQGEVRHNFQYSSDTKNREASAQRKRVLYVVGAMTDLEFSLRGIAAATREGSYFTAMEKRFQGAMTRLEEIFKLVDLPRLQEAIPPDEGLGLVKLNNQSALVDAAERLSQATKTFAANNDGSNLGPLDAIIPVPPYQGTAQP